MYEYKDMEFPTGLDESFAGSTGSDLAKLLSSNTPHSIKMLSDELNALIAKLNMAGNETVHGDVDSILHITKDINALHIKLRNAIKSLK